jgi:hypothetical protein
LSRLDVAALYLNCRVGIRVRVKVRVRVRVRIRIRVRGQQGVQGELNVIIAQGGFSPHAQQLRLRVRVRVRVRVRT